MSDQTSKLLKTVVISMGIMLIGGFIWVGAVVAQRAGETMAKPVASQKEPTECAEITLPRLTGAEVEFVDREWIITTHREIHRYSECGTLLQKVTLNR